MGESWRNDRLVRVLLVLSTLAAALYVGTQVWHLLSSVGDVLLLFFLAWLVAFTLRPLARFLQRSFGVRWPIAVAAVYLYLLVALVLVMLLVIPQMITQATQLVNAAPDLGVEAVRWLAWAQSVLASYNVDVDLTSIYRQQEIIPRVESIATTVLQNSVAILTGLASGILSGFFVLFLSLYFMLDDDGLFRDVLPFIPEQYHDEAIYLGDSIDRTFGGYMRGQLIQALVYGAGTALVMQLFGLPFVLLASTFAGIVMIIPLLGTYIAVVPPLLIALVQGDGTKFILVLVMLVVLQQLVLSLLMPRLLSSTVGVPPLGVLAAILLGAKLAGIAGAFFGVPIAGILAAMANFYLERRRQDQAAARRLADSGAGLPPAGLSPPPPPDLSRRPGETLPRDDPRANTEGEAADARGEAVRARR